MNNKKETASAITLNSLPNYSTNSEKNPVIRDIEDKDNLEFKLDNNILNKIPPLQRAILKNFLIPLNPDISITCLLNTLNSKLAQLATFKRIKIKETEYDKASIINYYGINIMGSGSGKDKTVREIDNHLFNSFRTYFISANEEHIKIKENELDVSAKDKFPTNKKKQADFIEKYKNKIRNIRFELDDATPEGLFADCETLQDSGIGSLFIKINELGLFLENPTQSQQLFMTYIIKLYDGEANIKSTKGESRSTAIKEIPCNCLLYSDTNKLLKGKANNYFLDSLDTGLGRRSFITLMPDKEIIINEDYELELEIKNKAYQEALNIDNTIYQIFINIEKDSIFQLSKEAYKIYHQYQNKNKKEFNKRLNKVDDILQKEIRGRNWKTLKLAGLIAAIEHPKEHIIKPLDMEYAIYQSELFAQDFEQFFKTKPLSDTDRLFQYFLSKKGEWITKQDIRDQKFTNNNYFAKWFSENLEYIKNMAEIQCYFIKQEKFNHNSSERYMLIDNKLGMELNNNILPFDKVIGL